MITQLRSKVLSQPYASLAWLLSFVSTTGSLYFSEIWGLAPCKLCWLQRVFMYPLVLVLAVGIWRKEKKIYEYVLPISLIGTAVALYHNILYYSANFLYGVNEFVVTSCSGGVSCTNEQVSWLGFVTIPFLSLVAFVLIDGLMLMVKQDDQASWWSLILNRLKQK